MPPTAMTALLSLAVALVAAVRLVLGIVQTAQTEPETLEHEAARVVLWQSTGLLFLVAAVTVGIASEATLERFPPILALLAFLGVATLIRSVILQRRLR